MKKRRPKKELTAEEQRGLLLRIEDALEHGREALAKLDSEEIQLLAWALDDATEDLNDAIRKTENGFRERNASSGRVSMDENRALAWNGQQFMIEFAGQKSAPLLSSSRKTRVDAVNYISELWQKVKRDT